MSKSPVSSLKMVKNRYKKRLFPICYDRNLWAVFIIYFHYILLHPKYVRAQFYRIPIDVDNFRNLLVCFKPFRCSYFFIWFSLLPELLLPYFIADNCEFLITATQNSCYCHHRIPDVWSWFWPKCRFRFREVAIRRDWSWRRECSKVATAVPSFVTGWVNSNTYW